MSAFPSWLEASNGVASASETNGGLHTSFKIGGYLSPQWALYFQREASWWSDEDIGGSTVVAGTTGVGASYYFQPYTQSLYLEFGAGIGDIVDISTDTFSEFGTGIVLGFGYEINEHLQIGGVATGVILDDANGVEYQTTSLAIKLEAKL